MRLSFGLSREVRLAVAGIFLNYHGYGAVLPFEVIYLHDGRGFSLAVAGLVVGVVTGAAVVTAPLSGPVIDRFGARATATWAGVALAAGYAGLAFASSPLYAFGAAALAGAGNGALNPSQSTLLTTLVRESVRPEPVTGGYRHVVRDRAFMHLALTNVAVIAIGWGAFTWLVPPYAKDEIGVGAPLIGLLLLANTAAVAVAQVPIARLAEGRRRVVLMALAGALFAVACPLVLAASVAAGIAYPMLLVAAVVVGVGECPHTTVLMPLTADLAPEALRGRYMAAMGLSWWIALAIAPTVGAALLARSPAVTFLVAAAVAAAGAAASLRLESKLSETARLTPRPELSGL
jgi:MFS family permease